MNATIIDKAQQYARQCHTQTNHTYNGKHYEFHLEMVFDFAVKYAHLVPENQRDNFLAAAWVHDVIEDCRETYANVLAATNKEVADLAYALTNEKGKTRSERANAKYYEGIKQVPYAVLLKVCDRLANLSYSIETSAKKTEMYVRENESFMQHLNDGSCVSNVQIVIDKTISNFDSLKLEGLGTCLRLKGNVVKSQGHKQKVCLLTYIINFSLRSKLVIMLLIRLRY